jgi:formylglycine-generating enzyme required for sulfatase activity
VAALDLVLLEVPAGRFTMGSPLSEEGRAQYEVHHEVNISQPFWLGKTELTQAQWQAVMGKNPAGFTGDLRRPVERVSWDDVMAFCKKLTERERAAGTLPPGYEYTLPTEAQWEYACRAGTTEAFAGELDAMAWYSANSGGSTHPVATKEPNHWGFHDMHGNVLEWCKDEYGDYPTGPVTDPQGASEGSIRVRRSGSWYDAAVNCRSANRGRGGPEARIDALGFRLCLAPVRL